jgi:hypothetical protein
MVLCVDMERIFLRAHVEAERGIEFARGFEIGDREIEAIKRMDAEFARAAVDRLRERTDLRHRTLHA